MQKFLVLELSIDSIRILKPLVEPLRTRDPALYKQIRAASSSIAMNIAEGNRRAGNDRRHHFRIASGSAAEVETALRVAIAWGDLDETAAGPPCRAWIGSCGCSTGSPVDARPRTMQAVPQSQLTRRCFLAAAALSAAQVLPPLTASGQQKKSSPHAADVDFLLTELEKQAGGFFKLKGIDWRAVAKQFRAEVKGVRTDAEHVKLCTRLVARLRDGHAALQDVKVEMPDEAKGRRFTGPRVHLLAQGGKVFVRAAFGSASEQGVQAGMEALSINSAPAAAWLKKRVDELRDDHGYSTDHAALYAACHWGLADWEGTRIDFELLRERQKKRVSIVRRGGPNFAPFGPAFPPKDLKQVGRQSYGKTASGNAYIHLRDVPGELPAQLDTMLAAVGDAPGLILDCRANGGGGCDHEAVFGRFLAAGTQWRQYRGQGTKPFAGPLVVIVDAGVRSAGETVSGMLKEDGRAYMIGDTPTSGSSSQKTTIAAPSGLFSVYFSVGSNKGRFNGGKGIEGIGVPPHETVPYDPTELLKGVDTQIRRAEELLKGGFPKGKVAYAPPGS